MQLGLTPAQVEFAEAHAAVPGLRPPYDDQLIFLYRSGERSTQRWLVDVAGRIVEAITLK